MSKRHALALIAAGFMLSATAIADPIAGPLGTYYITDGGNGTLYAIKDHAVGTTPMTDQTNKSEWPIAVVGLEVHTTGYYTGLTGSAYTGVNALTLTPTAAVYPALPDAQMLDGTSDGSHNYGVTYGAAGGTDAAKVFQFNTEWGDKQLLFTLNDIAIAGDKNYWVGITYDRTNNSLWMTNTRANLVADFDLAGHLIANSAFGVSTGTTMTALAMDIDHTLWMVDLNSKALYHYQTDGNLIGSFASNPALIFPYGGEIATPPCACVPEPASLTLFGAGALGGFGRRRKARPPAGQGRPPSGLSQAQRA